MKEKKKKQSIKENTKKDKTTTDIGPVDEEVRKSLEFVNLWHATVPSAADAFLDAVEKAHPGEGLKEAILRDEARLLGLDREGIVPFRRKPSARRQRSAD